MNQSVPVKGIIRFFRNALLVFSFLLCGHFMLIAKTNTLKVFALNGLLIDISKADEAELWASELNSGSYDFESDICEFRIGVPSKGAGQKEVPATERWVFSCEDASKMGTNIRVDFWAKNCEGEWAYVTTNVLLEDLQNTCNVIPVAVNAEIESNKQAADNKTITTVGMAKDKNEPVAGSYVEFDLYQNMPNPFKEQTLIGFNMSERGVASLKIFDGSGRTLKFVQSDFPKGYNEITIDRNELSGTGILYYTLESKATSKTKKMILTE